MSSARSAVAEGGPVQHQQEISRVRKRAVGLDHGLSFADAIIIRHDHGDLRGQANRFVHIRLAVVAFSPRDRKRTAQKPRSATRPWASLLRGAVRSKLIMDASTLRSSAKRSCSSFNSARVGSMPFHSR